MRHGQANLTNKIARILSDDRGANNAIASLGSMDLHEAVLLTIENRAINWELVTAGGTEEERMNNAKYVISVARKIGCCVFLTWEDIVEVKPKMIMTLCASLMAWQRESQQGGGGGGGGN